MSDDIVARLRIVSDMIMLGEKIRFASDTELMDEAADEITKLRAELAAANALAEQRLRGWVDEGKEKDALRTDLAAETERARKLEADGLAKFERIYLLEADLDAANETARAKLMDAEYWREKAEAAEADLAAARKRQIVYSPDAKAMSDRVEKLEADLAAARQEAKDAEHQMWVKALLKVLPEEKAVLFREICLARAALKGDASE